MDKRFVIIFFVCYFIGTFGKPGANLAGVLSGQLSTEPSTVKDVANQSVVAEQDDFVNSSPVVVNTPVVQEPVKPDDNTTTSPTTPTTSLTTPSTTTTPKTPTTTNTTSSIPPTTTQVTTITPITLPPTPNSTTVTPATTTPATTTPATTTASTPGTLTTTEPTPAPTPAPSNGRHFDGLSFIGGIVLSVGTMAIGFVAFKFYKARTERNYHTL